MNYLHYHDKDKLRKLYKKAVKEGETTITYQGNALLVEYLKFVLEMFDMKNEMTNDKNKPYYRDANYRRK